MRVDTVRRGFEPVTCWLCKSILLGISVIRDQDQERVQYGSLWWIPTKSNFTVII